MACKNVSYPSLFIQGLARVVRLRVVVVIQIDRRLRRHIAIKQTLKSLRWLGNLKQAELSAIATYVTSRRKDKKFPAFVGINGYVAFRY